MGKLFKKILLIAVPFVILGAYVIIVDPFDYFNYFSFIPDSVKYESVYNINPVLWDTFKFVHGPCPNIIIGDSRAQLISTEYLRMKTGKQFKHLSANAAKINEIIDYFWLANSLSKLKTVYIVLNFNMYNYYAFANRVAGAKAAIKNPLLYIFSNNVVRASFLVTKSIISNYRNIESARPFSKDEFWSWILNTRSYEQYGKWKYPMKEHERLKEVGEYCENNGIELIIIIAPHHVDFQEKVGEFNLNNEQEEFKRDLVKIAKTFDFDFASELTKNKANFRDPLHVTEEVENSIIDEVLSGKMKFGKLLLKK